MKIGLQTCFIDNYGACLQAYALKKVLENLNHNVDILPFDRYNWQKYSYSLKDKLRIIKNNHHLPIFDSSYNFSRKFIKFRKEYLKLDVNKINRKVSIFQSYSNNYDAFVCGSDLIWNPNFRKDNLYFDMLGFVEDDKLKISYAPSFGITKFPDDDIWLAKYYLNRFDYISCRESDGVNLINKDFNLSATHVLDPTLLVSSKEWLSLFKSKKYKRDYVFIYMFDNMPIKQIVHYILSTTNYDVRIIPFGNVSKDIFRNNRVFEHYKNCGPFDFLNLIKNAKLVIANSLHALAFSINFNTPFILFKRDNFSETKSINSRLTSMVYMFGINDRIIDLDSFKKNDIAKYTSMDFSLVNSLLDKQRELSLQFLIHALSDKKDKKSLNSDLSSKCVGCGLCLADCPKNAIKLNYNNSGFLKPSIDKGLCINCNRCITNCKSRINHFQPKERNWYFAQSEEKYENKCSSGGVFYVVAEKFINDGGYVCGAVLKHENNYFYCEHMIVNNHNDLLKLLGSKYIQSNASKSYAEIKKLLDNNKKVMFVGTPCQVGALSCYLKKDYDNLILVDFLCFGTMSTSSLNFYIEEIENKYSKKVVNISFRAKINGKKGTYYKYIFDDNSYIIEPAHFSLETPIGLHKQFCNQYNVNHFCSSCLYKTITRYSNITLGDLPIAFFTESFKLKHSNDFNMDRGISFISFDNKASYLFGDHIVLKQTELSRDLIESIPAFH